MKNKGLKALVAIVVVFVSVANINKLSKSGFKDIHVEDLFMTAMADGEQGTEGTGCKPTYSCETGSTLWERSRSGLSEPWYSTYESGPCTCHNSGQAGTCDPVDFNTLLCDNWWWSQTYCS
jgi:hypothetical protein